MDRTFNRHDVRQLVEQHLRRQFVAEGAGRWHAVQNDLNDELADITAQLVTDCGEAAAQRFGRLYAEEVLAVERDMRSTPHRTAARLFGDKGPASRPDSSRPIDPAQLLLVAPKGPAVVPWVLVLIVAGILLAVL